jgi:GNAT superfamily N-acetyltransferase
MVLQHLFACPRYDEGIVVFISEMGMKVRLQDLDRAAIARVIEGHVWELYRLLGRWPRVEVHDDPDVLFFISGVPHPVFNCVMGARLEPGAIEARIDTIIAHYKARGVPLLWLIGPQTRPYDLGIRLEVHGFRHTEDAPGLAVDLSMLPTPVAPQGFVIRRVDHEESLEQWCAVAASAFELPQFVGDAFYELGVSIGFEQDRAAIHYLGYIDGKPVATATLVPGAEVAGLFNVATLPEVRRKGLATATSLTALHDARVRGYNTGVLCATPLALSLYKRLGFDQFCTLAHYVRIGPNYP